MRLHTLIPVLERADGAPDRQAAQDIVDRHDQALGVMPPAGRRQAAVGIERLPDGLSGRQGVGGPIECEDGQAMPLILLTRRKHLVGQRDGAAEQGRQGLPGRGPAAPFRARGRRPSLNLPATSSETRHPRRSPSSSSQIL